MKYLNKNTWLKDRHHFVGASEVPILCGESTFKTPLELWDEKVNQTKPKISDELQTLFDAGKDQEPITLYRFLKKRNHPMAEKVLINHYQNKKLSDKDIFLFTEYTHKDIIAHPDMIFKMDGELINVEAKYVKYNSSEWNLHYDDEYGTQDDIPFKYYIQVQAQMLATGTKKTILCANFQGSDHYEFMIESNEEIFSTIEKLTTDFMDRVRAKEPVMPTTRSDWKKLFPNNNKTALTLPDEISIETALMKDRFSMIKKRMKTLKKEEDNIKTSILSLMANNSVLQTSGGETLASITEYNSEAIIALSKLKKDKPKVYAYLKKNECLYTNEITRLNF